MKRRSVALLIETSNGYCRGLLEGIGAFARSRTNWSVHLNEQERGANPPPWIHGWNGDGIIARIETDEIGRQLKRLPVPIVDLSAARVLPGIPWADTDDGAIARLGVEHFLDRGFQNLAFCGDPGFAWSTARSSHFHALADKVKCNYFEHAITHRYDPEYKWNRVHDTLAQWLKGLPRPVGIMACNDYLGQLILDVCRTEQISVPEEMAVLGVDNDQLICEFSDPQLSSVIPDTFRTGFEAAELLEGMMNDEGFDPQARLVTQPLGIKLRESTDTIAIDDPEVSKALVFIRRNALGNVRVVDVLKQCTISRRALEHRFVKHVGHTPHEEIIRIRMARVKHLLQHTDELIVNIARQTGYEHPEYFTAAFRQHTGETPSQYRQRTQARP